jgi:predicted transcriptional regulator
MSEKRHRCNVTARIDPEVLEVVQAVAQQDRRPVSNLLRNIIADWALARRERAQEQSA